MIKQKMGKQNKKNMSKKIQLACFHRQIKFLG